MRQQYIEQPSSSNEDQRPLPWASVEPKKLILFERFASRLTDVEEECFQADPTKPTWALSDDATVEVFKRCSRDDLDALERVCRRFCRLVYRDPSVMPTRKVDYLEISSNKEFTASFYVSNLKRTLAVKKYFQKFDIDTIVRDVKELNPNGYRLVCDHPSHQLLHSADPGTYPRRYCRDNTPFVYKKHAHYVKKVFTFPLEFFYQLQQLLEHCSVNYLVFKNFVFYDLFVEKWVQLISSRFHVNTLSLHNCSLKHITTDVFHQFIGRNIIAKRYVLEHFRNSLPNHISFNLLNTEGLLNCQSLYIGFILNRHKFPQTLPEEDFIRYLEERTRHGGEGVFCRVISGREPREIEQAYKRLYERELNEDKRRSLFPSLTYDSYHYTKPEFDLRRADKLVLKSGHL